MREPLDDRGSSRDETLTNVAVLSVPFGGGHQAVAEGVEHALNQSLIAEAQVHVLDALDLLSSQLPLSRWGASLYYWLTQPVFRPLYRVLFHAVDRWPSLGGRIGSILFRRRADRWLRQQRPDVVVSTFPFISYVMGAALQRRRDTQVRLITIVTDG